MVMIFSDFIRRHLLPSSPIVAFLSQSTSLVVSNAATNCQVMMNAAAMMVRDVVDVDIATLMMYGLRSGQAAEGGQA